MIRDDLVLHVEAALLAAGRPVAVDELVAMFGGREDAPDRRAIRDAVDALAERWHGRAVEVGEVASGFRAQIRREFSQTISALWQERPARYSRALLETLALIAYRQPVSRGEIEEIRGVSVSSSIMKTLLEREWVRVVGHREAPGRPALYGTTKHFLDAFNLRSLEALPPLAELRELEDPPPDLFAGPPDAPATGEDPEPPGSGGVEARAADADAAPGSPAPREGSAPVERGVSVEDAPEPAEAAVVQAAEDTVAPSGGEITTDMRSAEPVPASGDPGPGPHLVDGRPEPTGETGDRQEFAPRALHGPDRRPEETLVDGDPSMPASGAGAGSDRRVD